MTQCSATVFFLSVFFHPAFDKVIGGTALRRSGGSEQHPPPADNLIANSLKGGLACPIGPLSSQLIPKGKNPVTAAYINRH